MPLFRRFHCLLAVGLLPPAAPASAVEYCVGTSQELNAALTTVALPMPNSEVVIRIKTGSYMLNAAALDALLQINNDLRLLGGYSGTDCVQRGVDPAATRLLTSSGQYPDILVGDRNLLLERLAIESSTGVELRGQWYVDAPGRQFVVRQVHIDTVDGLSLEPTDHEVRIENSLILGRGLVYQTSFDDETESSLPFTLVGSTVISDFGAAVRLYRGEGVPAAQISLYNNILQGTPSGGGVGYASPGSQLPHVVHAFNNLWNGVHVPVAVQGGNSTADPLLGAGYLPSASSPAVNAGLNAVPGGVGELDAVGTARQIGSRVDIGARETAIDDAQALVVTNANDSGAGSFRQALINANANADFNDIRFNVPLPSGQCLLLQPATAYPDIVHPVRIDGLSQPGSASNTLQYGDNANICVRIVKLGTRLPYGLRATGGRLILRGVGIGGFDRALELADGSGHRITGSHFGTGLVNFFPGNGIGINIAAQQVTVGGYGVAERNVIAGSDGNAGILVQSSDATINGNHIGTSRDGQSSSSGLANVRGIWMAHANRGNVVINNVISGNDIGILARATSYGTMEPNRYGGNRIGLRALALCVPLPGLPSCADDLGNRLGIFVDHDDVVVPGLGERIANNRIAYNTEQGVLLMRSDSVRLSQNAIYANGGIGIDLVSPTQPDGPNYIWDDGPSAPNTAVNRGQNAPEPASAIGNDNEGVVHAKLRSHNGSFRIEAFSSPACDGTGYGEGQSYLGSMQIEIDNATPDAMGQRVFAMPIARAGGGPLIGKAITLTATSALEDTSEFSSCVGYVDEGGDYLFANGFEEVLE